MPKPYVSLGGVKIAPFKNPSTEPYGVFANTTPSGKYPIKQTVTIDGNSRTIVWPSSEHAFHAQKILHLKGKLPASHPAQETLTKMLNEIAATHAGTNKEYLPRDDYDPLVNKYLDQLNKDGLDLKDKYAFDALCDADFHATKNPEGKKETINFMRTVIEMKLGQHPELREKAMECAREGILPVEISQYDVNWASGPDGNGLNMLGILILEEGNKLLIQKGEKPCIPNPTQAYQQLQSTHSAALAHNNQVNNLTPNAANWVFPKSNPPIQFKGSDYYSQPIMSASEMEQSLQKGIVPLVSDKETVLDGCLNLGINKKDAAQLLAAYSVKSAMSNLNAQVKVQMVSNTRANVKGHDPQAMKITFNSQQEAQEFCERLYKEHGIHSLTRGPGKMKSPQNGSVFLTKQDLDKLAQHAQLSKSNVGKLAFDALANSFSQAKQDKVEDKKDDSYTSRMRL